MHVENGPVLADKEELERNAAGFRYLAPNGIYDIDPSVEAPLVVKSSYREAKVVSDHLNTHKR